MKNLCKENSLAITENKWDVKYIQILPAPTEGATENIGEDMHQKVFITQKFTQCKASRTLRIDVFKIPDNKNIRKLFSKYKLLFLDEADSSQDPSQILILQFAIPRASLPPSPSLSNFTLTN